MAYVIDEILDKLDVLKSLDTEFEIFGADFHKYRVRRVVSMTVIQEFEDRYHCKLPESYRLFLTEIGNGGAGPYYGVNPLGHMDENYGHSLWTSEMVRPEKPFKYTSAFNDTSILERGCPEEAAYDSSSAYSHAYLSWQNEYSSDLQEEYWMAHMMDGAIPVCHRGCARSTWLVVAEGKERGNIWHDDTVDSEGVYPEIPSVSKHRANFGEWYLAWLNKSIQQITNQKSKAQKKP